MYNDEMFSGEIGQIVDRADRDARFPERRDDLGARGVVQLLVEGGARVAHDFVEGGFVNRLVAYVAPMLFGGDDGSPVLKGAGAPSIVEL